MKKITVLLACIIPSVLLAQSVSINTDASAPHYSALLDIKSDSKGLLMPRLTTLQRTSIAGPATGLTVFDMDTYSYWMFRGDLNGGWAEMQHNYQNLWAASGNNIFNKNSGSVGFGTSSSFNAELKLNGQVTPARFAFMHQDVPIGFMTASIADGFKIGTYNASNAPISFAPNGVEKMRIDENGKVGIGTSNLSSILTINGINPKIQIRQDNTDVGYLRVNGPSLLLGTDQTNTTGNIKFETKFITRVTIDENGQMGIGCSPTSILSINASNPIIQLKDNQQDKGFVQIVNDDIKIGTNLNNPLGKFMVRTNGADRVTVNENGNVGIGLTNPLYKLDVNGTSRFVGNQTITGNQSVSGLITGGDIDIVSSSPSLEINTTLNGTYGRFEIDNSNNVVLGKSFYGSDLVLDGAIGSTTKQLHLSKANQFNFGTGNYATNYTLSVEGLVIATGFTTSPIANWPDYVFADTYNLKPLSEVKKYIAQNKHLENIPAALEIEKKGIELGDMSKRLMEKVEELTLYIINMQEQIDAIKKNK